MNPAVPAPQKIAILDKLNAKLGMQKELRNLIAVLIHNDRIGHVVEVAAAYRSILQEQLGIRPAEIVTARELSEDERTRWWRKWPSLPAQKSTPASSSIKYILGGAVVRIGSTVYDGSVRGRLDRLKEALTAG